MPKDEMKEAVTRQQEFVDEFYRARAAFDPARRQTVINWQRIVDECETRKLTVDMINKGTADSARSRVARAILRRGARVLNPSPDVLAEIQPPRMEDDTDDNSGDPKADAPVGAGTKGSNEPTNGSLVADDTIIRGGDTIVRGGDSKRYPG